MGRITLLFKIILVYVLKLKVTLADSGDVYYVAQFTDEITDCDDFHNDVIQCNGLSIDFVPGAGDKEGGLGMSGALSILRDIKDDYNIEIKIWKEVDIVKEFMYSVQGNLCDSLTADDTPWYPLVEIFNTTECPIKQNTYPIKDLVLSLDFAKDVLRHEMCGDYTVELSVITGLEQQLSCHVIPVTVLEKNDDKCG